MASRRAETGERAVERLAGRETAAQVDEAGDGGEGGGIGHPDMMPGRGGLRAVDQPGRVDDLEVVPGDDVELVHDVIVEMGIAGAA